MYKSYYVYFMTSANHKTLYVGVTNDLERRVREHRAGLISGFTQKYHCDKLVYYEVYSDVNDAISREKQLKRWSRKKKDELINSSGNRDFCALLI